MNSLSWMIYLADVTGSVATFMTIVAVSIGILGGTILTISGLVAHADGDDVSHLWPWGRRIAFVVVPCGLLAALIPSQNTIYAIAASEMGEAALNSETGGKAVEALNAWLDRQIAGEGEQK